MVRSRAFLIAVSAIMIAVAAVFTLLVRIPVPGTQEYVNFSDVAVNFAALAFGPWIGLIAGAIGPAIADVVGGYPQWAPLTLLAHGLQGLAVGLLARRKTPWRIVLAWAVGAAIMVAFYFLGAGAVLSGWGVALVGLPFNILQAVVGGVVGIPLYYAVLRAYPPVAQMSESGTWREG